MELLMSSHARVSLSAATDKHWLLDVKLNGTWEPAFLQDAGEIQVTKIADSRIISCNPAEIEIAPTRFECRDFSFEQVYKSVDAAKFTVLALVEFQSQLESLVSGQSQFGQDLESYQFFNSDLPVKLFCALHVPDSTDEGQQRSINAIYSSISSLLAKTVPELPGVQSKSEDEKLRWTWPGVIESIRLLLNSKLPPQFLGTITFTDDTPDTLPASNENKAQLFAFKTMQRAGVWELLKQKIRALDSSSFSFANISELVVFKNLKKILKSEFCSAYYSEILPAVFALTGEMSPYQEDAVLESLESISELIQRESNLKQFSDAFSNFSSRLQWTKCSPKVTNMIYTELNLASDKRSLIQVLKSDGSLDSFLKSISINERESFIHLVNFAQQANVLAALLSSTRDFPEKISALLGYEFLFDSLENKKWDLLQSLTAVGLRSSQLPAPPNNQSTLLTFALGRSIPADLFTTYFDHPLLVTLHPFRMIATRYPEYEQQKLLGHIATRQVLITLLSDEKVRSSEAYKNADVQTLLRTILFRDRLQLLWLRGKVNQLVRLPLGLTQHIVLEYLW